MKFGNRLIQCVYWSSLWGFALNCNGAGPTRLRHRYYCNCKLFSKKWRFLQCCISLN